MCIVQLEGGSPNPPPPPPPAYGPAMAEKIFGGILEQNGSISSNTIFGLCIVKTSMLDLHGLEVKYYREWPGLDVREAWRSRSHCTVALASINNNYSASSANVKMLYCSSSP